MYVYILYVCVYARIFILFYNNNGQPSSFDAKWHFKENF